MGDVAGRGQVEQSFEVPYNVRFEIIRGVEAGGRSYTGEEGEHPGTIEDYAGVVVLLNDLEQISERNPHILFNFNCLRYNSFADCARDSGETSGERQKERKNIPAI